MMHRKLKELLGVIADEANINPDFAAKLARVFGDETTTRARGKRPLAIIDPIAVYQTEAEQGLRLKLRGLTLDQLRDIVSEYGTDKSQFVMKWIRPERVIDHIIATAATRARKGDAFR